MSALDREANMARWTGVFRKEVARRKALLKKNPKAAQQLVRMNPRGLIQDCGKEHVWVPASTVWIHDGARGSFVIDGVKRRGLREAMCFTDKAKHVKVVPQVCNNCCAVREKESAILTEQDRQEIAAAEKKARRKARRMKKLGAVKPETTVSLEDFGL